MALCARGSAAAVAIGLASRLSSFHAHLGFGILGGKQESDRLKLEDFRIDCVVRVRAAETTAVVRLKWHGPDALGYNTLFRNRLSNAELTSSMDSAQGDRLDAGGAPN